MASPSSHTKTGAHFTNFLQIIMPLQNFIILQACTLSAIFLLSLFFLPCLIVGFTFITFSCFIFLPILCIFSCIYLFFWVSGLVSLRPIWNVFLWVWVCFLGAQNNEQKKFLSIENTQVSVVFDPSEIPYFSQSEEEDDDDDDDDEGGDKVMDGREESGWTSWCVSEEEIMNDSREIQVVTPYRSEEDKSVSQSWVNDSIS